MIHYLHRDNNLNICGFLSRNHEGQKEMEQHFKSSNRKTPELSILFQQKSCRNEGEIKTFSDELKLREFIGRRHALRELLKEFLQTEEK